MRLDKYLAQAGLGTRSEVKKLIRSGRVLLNGKLTKSPECKVETSDEVMVDDRQITYEEYVYYMLNKPGGVVTATIDSKDKTVIDLLKEPYVKDLFPVGRLDKDTEGLLLLTNHGALAHRLLAPKSHVEKGYYARLEKPAIQCFLNGLDIGDKKPTKPARLKILSGCEVMIWITEGRFHQIKRMCQKIGKPVRYLKRIQMGTLRLDESLAQDYKVVSIPMLLLFKDGEVVKKTVGALPKSELLAFIEQE